MKTGKFWVALLALLVLGLGCSHTGADMKKKQTAEAYFKLGVFYLENGNYKAAIPEFRKALDLDPNEAMYHFSLGTAYSMDGRDKEAIDELNTSLRLNPQNSEAHNNLGFIYAKNQKWPEAIAEFKAALANRDYGRPYSAHLNLAECYFRQGDIDASVEEYKQAIQSKPDSDVAHLGLAKAYLLKGEPGLAVEEFQESLKTNNKQPQIDFWYSVGRVYLNKGNKAEAISSFEKVIELDPKSPLAQEARKQLESIKR